MIYRKHNTTKQFAKEIPPLKSKAMTFKGRVPIRSINVTAVYWNK
jgi:hypothetical protein